MSCTSFLAHHRASTHSSPRRRPRASVRATAFAVLALVAAALPVAVPAAASATAAPGGGVHASAAQAGGFVPLAAPQRLLDTRTSGGCVATTRTLTVTGVAGIPSGVPAVVLNVAAVGALMPGFLRTYPADQSPPATSTLNFQASEGISNAVVAKPSAAGAITFQAMAGTCPHVVVDVTGYFTSGSAGPGGYVAASTPQRVLDTRSGGGACVSTTRTLQLGGVSGIPANASSVFVNVAAVSPTAAGTLKLYPSDTDFVSGVNVTYNPSRNVSTSSVLKPGADGAVRLAASGGCPHVVVDVVGWTTAGTPGVGGVVPLTNRRIMDTRPAGAGGCVTTPRELVVSPLDPDLGGVPAGAGSVLLAVTATGAATAGFGRVYPGGQAEPAASTINYQAGANMTNLVMARVGSGGAVMFSAMAGSCPHLVVELLGYTVGDPATAPAPVTYTQVSPGPSAFGDDAHSCAVTSAGTVRCWGSNAYGQLGNGTQVFAAAPVGVAGLTGAAQVASGTAHSCARTTSGGVWCWGDNSGGQVGDGTTTSRTTPRQIFLANATQLSAGQAHTCARLSDGTARCWGSNGSGQVGDGTTDDALTPKSPRLTGVTQVAAGGSHSCAQLTSGAVRCWGEGWYGQLGDGSGNPSATPVTVYGVVGATQVVSGMDHSCALLAGGTAKCWGSNDAGQLGDGTTDNALRPVAVAGLSGAVELAAGSSTTCARFANGSVKCWGFIQGDATGTPTTVAGVSSPSQMGLGFHTCFVQAGRVRCVGDTGSPGVASLGTGVSAWAFDSVRPSLANVSQVASGGDFTCAVVSGAVKCWGLNGSGQLGDGTTTGSATPVTVSGLSGVTQVAAAQDFACALLSGGTVKCWGYNGFGQLGNGTFDDSATPVAVSGVSGATRISVGGGHVCALVAGGAAKCWGNGYYGQLGNGAGEPSETPVPVTGLTGATQISAGDSVSCALVASAVKCWGAGTASGDPQGSDRLVPGAVAGVSGVTSLSQGYSAQVVCATTSSNVYCWGDVADAVDGVRNLAAPTVVPGLAGATSMGTSANNVCASVAGTVRCVGQNTTGQFGDRTQFSPMFGATPSVVSQVAGTTSFSLSFDSGCAVTAPTPANVLRCWGSRTGGKLGVPDVADVTGLATVVN